MGFKKGVSGNPHGRPKGSKNSFSIKELEGAIRKVESLYHEDFLVHVIKRSYESDKVLVAVLKKLIPDKVDKNELEITNAGEYFQEIARAISRADTGSEEVL